MESYESRAAFDNEEPVGFYTLEEKDGRAWLENLWVLPEYMGKSIGRAFFLHAVELARERGYKILQLEADPHAVGFYKKLGMDQVSERRYEIEGKPRILPTMELKL